MDKRIDSITDSISRTLGLERLTLEAVELFERPSAFGGSDVILSADWLPADGGQPEGAGSLPAGAVSVDYSLRFGQILLVAAAGHTSAAERLTADPDKTEFFKRWTERTTGLEFGTSLSMTSAGRHEFTAVVSHEGIPVTPESRLELEWSEDGRLLTAILPILASDRFEAPEFKITLEDVEPLVRQQVSLVRLPHEEEERFTDCYAVDEIYISQEGTVLPYFSEDQSAVFPRTILTWEPPAAPLHVERQPVRAFRSFSDADEAYRAAVPASNEIGTDAMDGVSRSAVRFLSSHVPDESGEWELYRMIQQGEVFEAECRVLGGVNGPLQRKLRLLMDSHTYDVLNYMDSLEMAGLFEGYTQPRTAAVTFDEAYEKMLPYIYMEPAYVYHQKSGTYKLCGLLDSEECVDAVTGELKNLNDV